MVKIIIYNSFLLECEDSLDIEGDDLKMNDRGTRCDAILGAVEDDMGNATDRME